MLSIQESKWTCESVRYTLTMMTAAQLTCVCMIHCDHDDCCTAYMCLYDTLWPWWLLHSLHVSVRYTLWPWWLLHSLHVSVRYTLWPWWLLHSLHVSVRYTLWPWWLLHSLHVSLYDTLWPWWLLHSLHVSVRYTLWPWWLLHSLHVSVRYTLWPWWLLHSLHVSVRYTLWPWWLLHSLHVSVRYTVTMMTAAQLTCVCTIHCDHDDCCTAYMCLCVGCAFTRFQTMRLTRVFPNVLSEQVISYGSCQFPTLGFVVDRVSSFFKSYQATLL